MDLQKPTWKTTEFGFKAAVILCGLLLVTGIVDSSDMVKMGGYAGAVVAAAVYGINRTGIKKKHIDSGEATIMFLSQNAWELIPQWEEFQKKWKFNLKFEPKKAAEPEKATSPQPASEHAANPGIGS